LAGREGSVVILGAFRDTIGDHAFDANAGDGAKKQARALGGVSNDLPVRFRSNGSGNRRVGDRQPGLAVEQPVARPSNRGSLL
jgi:hypothetical protein